MTATGEGLLPSLFLFLALDYQKKPSKAVRVFWGSIPMPPQKIPEAEARQIVQWILSLE